ncbi:hypothetical protein N7466_003308 [Penicillium verhagenii]|uniref:uncharacterized protein n=1 Tax=Penicillium verhagenii TaxID=1562060 RepID=UPI002545568F|nr:uncharacterized protein N7466_003308 [Penicillium verhagenii]KAJ5936858.1 hypothetical protein N7466_003308 [Penicillium verhagenii]
MNDHTRGNGLSNVRLVAGHTLGDGDNDAEKSTQADALLERTSLSLDGSPERSEGLDGVGRRLPSDELSSSPQNTPPECPTPEHLIVQDIANNDWNVVDYGGHMSGPSNQCPQELPETVEHSRALEMQMADDQILPQSPAIFSPRGALNPFDAHLDWSLGPTQIFAASGTPNTIPPTMDFSTVLLDGFPLSPPTPRGQHASNSPKDGISNEQFEQVRRSWPTRRRAVTFSPSPVSWDDILLHPEANIFSSISLKALADLEPIAVRESSWGFTEFRRNSLVQLMARYALVTANDIEGASPASLSPWNGEPPPTDILDLCLDLYFGQFHVNLPFIHPGTFDASLTPEILLFPMCLVGMMILNRSVARQLIADFLPVSYIVHLTQEG